MPIILVNYIEPVTDVLIIPIDGKRFVTDDVMNHQWNTLLMEMVRSVVIL